MKELKELGEVLLLLILNIAIAPLRAFALLLIANLFGIGFITQFSFVQVIGIVTIFKLISVNVKNNGSVKIEAANQWKDLRLKVLHIALSVGLAYMFFYIFN